MICSTISVNMLPSAMQGDASKSKPCSSKTGDDNNEFEEMVGASKLISSTFPLIGSIQICSALRRGVQILSQAESGSLQSQDQHHQGESVCDNMKGISRVLKNAAQLKPAIDNLMRKVIEITIWQVSG